MNYFTIDGVSWTVPCDIERVSEIRKSDISGELLTGDYWNDVLGQYLTYTVSLVIPRGSESAYSAFYELLTNPVASHTFVMPYNQTTISMTGRVEQVSDNYIYEEGSGVTWRHTKFVVFGNVAHKRPTLAQAIAANPGD